LIRLRILLLVLAVFVADLLPLHAATPPLRLAVIAGANSGLAAISLEQLKLIFKRKSQVDPQGRRWVPLNLPATDPLRRAFSWSIYEEMPEDMETYWNAEYFHGITPPQVLASEEAVIRFVAVTAGAIGYVRETLVDERVKVLRVIAVADEN
jgi:hypothetical protein